MNTRLRSIAPEVLETRIAPASFFLHGNNLTITDGTGTVVTNDAPELAAVAATGATRALLMNAGDKLFFDLNGDNDAGDAGDLLMATVSAGKAMLFFTDRAAGPGIGGFQPVEWTGAAVGDGFKGVFETRVNGAVVTALDGTGSFTFVNTDADPQMESVQIIGASIAGLVAKDVIAGVVQAGKNIANLKLLGVSPGAAGARWGFMRAPFLSTTWCSIPARRFQLQSGRLSAAT